MCVFVFSDLHGNITQLKKVVALIEKEKSYTCNFFQEIWELTD